MKKLIALTAVALMFSGPVMAAKNLDSIVDEFENSGLEFEDATHMGPSDYGAAPFLCDGEHFFIPSLGGGAGGRVFVCKKKADRDRLASYYRELGKSSALFFSWVFVKGNVVLQLNGNLDEHTAKEYASTIP